MAWFGWALLAMGFMGLANLGMKAASLKGLGPASVLFWVVLGEIPVALAYWAWRGRPTGAVGGAGWALGAGVFTAVALILLNESFSRGAKAALAVGIMNANFALVALLAFFLFREQLQPTKLVGLAATLSGLWLMAR
jgi:drug/metabolite transporter (DMT)-like permease